MGRSTMLPDSEGLDYEGFDSEGFKPIDAAALARLEALRDASAAKLEAAQSAAVKLVAAQNAAVAGKVASDDEDGSEGGGRGRRGLAGYVLSLLSRSSEEIVVSVHALNASPILAPS